MIVGITGTLGAGKGTIADFLKKRGFVHYSVRDFLVEEILKRGMINNRDSMVFVANDLREKFGLSYIVKELYSKAEKVGGKCVIESLRCPGEIEDLKKKKNFVLLAIDADIETRYARIFERASASDRISFDEFVIQEQKERTSNNPNNQNLRECIKMADYCFKNDWTIAELHKKIEKVLDNIKNKNKKCIRPRWDEYFVEIMKAVATRVTCDRARAGGGGCVVVRDKHILVTGYVGSPPGCSHCDDVGHQFKKTIHENGDVTNHCVRTAHAEQNAICQAAKMGISLNNATLYNFMTPCYTCAKLIITAGIKRVVALKDYHASEDSKNLFKEASVKFELLNKNVQQYENM